LSQLDEDKSIGSWWEEARAADNPQQSTGQRPSALSGTALLRGPGCECCPANTALSAQIPPSSTAGDAQIPVTVTASERVVQGRLWGLQNPSDLSGNLRLSFCYSQPPHPWVLHLWSQPTKWKYLEKNVCTDHVQNFFFLEFPKQYSITTVFLLQFWCLNLGPHAC
jgi:hypothetical protein